MLVNGARKKSVCRQSGVAPHQQFFLAPTPRLRCKCNSSINGQQDQSQTSLGACQLAVKMKGENDYEYGDDDELALGSIAHATALPRNCRG